jgi:cyanate permease
MIAALHMDFSEAGFGFTLLALAAGLSGMLPAVIIRRIGARATLGCGVLAMLAAYVTLASARMVAVYYAGTLFLGLGFSLIGTIPALHILSTWEKRRRALIFGAYLACGGLGGALWPSVVVAAIAAFGGWRGYWWFMAGLIAVVGGISLSVLHERAAAPEDDAIAADMLSGWSLWEAMRTRQFAIITAGVTVHNLVATTVNAFTVSYLKMIGVSTAVAVITFSIQSACHALFPLMMGGLARRLGVMGLLVLGLGMQTVGLVALAEGSSLPMLIIFAVGVGGGHGTMLLATTVSLESYFGQLHFGQILGVNQAFTTISVVGPVLAGYVADRTGRFDTSFLGCAALMLAVTLAAATLRPPLRRGKEALLF